MPSSLMVDEDRGSELPWISIEAKFDERMLHKDMERVLELEKQAIQQSMQSSRIA